MISGTKKHPRPKIREGDTLGEEEVDPPGGGGSSLANWAMPFIKKPTPAPYRIS